MNTQRIYVLLGRAGDVLNFLPVLWKEAQDGHRACLFTTSPFHEILDGVTYADVKIYPGQPSDITGAVNMAKGLSSDVKVVQVAGPAEEIHKHSFEKAQTDSWCKEAFRLAGHYDWWKLHLPLVFDKRDVHREAALCPDFLHERKPTILVATGGVSSPFQYATLLRGLLELRFRKPAWRILDIGKLKAHRLYDLLGIMEKAKFLVTTDSSPLHLARAVPTLPVLAMTNDKPGLWNGSAWHPQQVWTCRYSDFPRRAMSMLEAMENVSQGSVAYNPLKRDEKPKLIHVFSTYEGASEEAKQNWRKTYETSEDWIHAPVYFGMFGRDSRFGGVPDEKLRLPFLKDVIRAAVARSSNLNDKIVLTKSDTCFLNTDFPDAPAFSHRTIRDKGYKLTHNPAIDLFAFTRKWWNDHASEMPDMILGRDVYWQRCLKALILKHGGVEIPFLTYQSRKEAE